jgi:branched-chain amino acid transport system substrate-binding protein
MNKPLVLFTLAAITLTALACTPSGASAPTASASPLIETSTPAATLTLEPTKTSEATATPAQSPTPTVVKSIKIGLLSDQSGALHDYATMLENGFALGLDYATDGKNSVAGRAVQVVVKDSAGKNDVGAQAARDLIEKDQVDLLIAPPSSSVALGVSDLARQAKKVVIHTTASPDVTGKGFNPYAFRAARATMQDTLAMAIALTRLGRSFIQIAPDNPIGQSAAAALYDAIKARGGRFVINDAPGKSGTTFIPVQARDLPPYFQVIVSPPLPEYKADVVIVSWTGAGFVNLYLQMQQAGVFKAATVAALIPDSQAIKTGFTSAIGVVGVTNYHYALPQNKVNDWLVEKHKQKFTNPPDLLTETGFTAAQMVVAALKATNGDASADNLIPVLEKLSFDGVKGTYAVRASDHVLLQPLYFVKIANTSSADFRFLSLVFELKPDEIAPPCTLEGEYKSRCTAK